MRSYMLPFDTAALLQRGALLGRCAVPTLTAAALTPHKSTLHTPHSLWSSLIVASQGCTMNILSLLTFLELTFISTL